MIGDPAFRPLPPPERVPWERLGWLGWPEATRHHWVMAPEFLNFDEAEAWAHLWAEHQGGRAEIVELSTGDTLVRLVRA